MTTVISKADFPKCKRELILDYGAYLAEAEDLLGRIPKAAKKLSDPDYAKQKDAATLLRLTHARAEYALDLLALSYSAGSEVRALRDFYPALLSFYEEYALYSEAYNATAEGSRDPLPDFALGDFDFSRANRLLSFAILLGYEQYVPRVMALIDYNNPVRDGMLERLAACYIELPEPFPAECTRHLPYFKTLGIFDAPAAARPKLMREYLEDWYEASRREPYFDSHARRNQFLGYWSWEAAAISVALDIDDRLYRELQFYPRDLVDYWKSEISNSRTSHAHSAELRAKAGEPCPANGIWESIGIPVQQIRYSSGTPMQDLGSPYGLTVWRYLGA